MAADVVFVVVVFAAVYLRRFGSRGRALGMVAFMAYFFTLYLRAGISELPWMIGAVVVGTVCTFVMSTYVSPIGPIACCEPPFAHCERGWPSWSTPPPTRCGAGRLDERRRRRFRARIARLDGPALLVQSQIEDKCQSGHAVARGQRRTAGPVVVRRRTRRRMGRDRRSTCRGRRTGNTCPLPGRTGRSARRARLGHPGPATRRASPGRAPRSAGFRQASHPPPPPTIPAQCRRPSPRAGDNRCSESDFRRPGHWSNTPPSAARQRRRPANHRVHRADGCRTPPSRQAARAVCCRPTRQAIQVAVAASLAIVTGELVSPSRWYWAVIAAFVVFAGTKSWGETLTKGWQRVFGTVLGVPSGVLVASAGFREHRRVARHDLRLPVLRVLFHDRSPTA